MRCVQAAGRGDDMDDGQEAGDRASEDGLERRTHGEPVFSNRPLGEAWGESITKRKASYLEDRLQVWELEDDHGSRKGPFESTSLTGADVFWLAARALAGKS